LNIQIPGIDAQDLLCSTPQVALAMGSACSSSVPKPSHVLSAMGLNWQAAASSLRMSFGRMSSEQDMTRAVQALAAGIPQAATVGGND
jgi:cysteine desulfurase